MVGVLEEGTRQSPQTWTWSRLGDWPGRVPPPPPSPGESSGSRNRSGGLGPPHLPHPTQALLAGSSRNRGGSQGQAKLHCRLCPLLGSGSSSREGEKPDRLVWGRRMGREHMEG